MWFEMHKHTQYSMYDGFDKIKNIVAYAKELGMKAIGISDHGNACGIAQLYLACKKEGLKPIMGCEVYFQPVFDSAKKRYHLCLYAINETGYRNLSQIISEANDVNYYRYGHVTFEILSKYSEGIICTSACVGGFIPQAIINGDKALAVKALKKFKSIFNDNFCLEIMPIKVDDVGTQEKVNERLMQLGSKYEVKCIITTDSHFTRKDDFDSYIVMHKMGKIGSNKGEGIDVSHVEETYKERYMHSKDDIASKFKKMHGFYPHALFGAMKEIYDKIDVSLSFEDSIPTYEGEEDTYQLMKKICLRKLKKTGRYTKEYIDVLKHELTVIKNHDLCDYFLIVRDYVVWALENGIYVGPGRGSVGGSLAAELMDITQLDPLELGTDFERFLRADKKKLPDIDLDFESGRQKEVIDYVLSKYPERSTQIITFGYYKGKNLINDLCKVYETGPTEVARIKLLLGSKVSDMAHFEMVDVDLNELMKDRTIRDLNKEYPGIVKHFCKLFGQVKYYGQHPAGVLVTKDKISKFVPLAKVKGKLISSFDKYDIEALDMLKFDILALRTLDVIKEIEQITGDKFNRLNYSEDVKAKMYDKFSKGDTLGIFQLNKPAAQGILRDIEADNLQDVIAAISLNRPGTLKLRMHEQYAEQKRNVDDSAIWYPYTKDSYGAIIYQEHVMRLCQGLARMEPGDIDKLMKFKFSEVERESLKDKFIEGAKRFSGVKSEVSRDLFEAMANYMFNKGHGAGYALISEWQMYHKVKHPVEFWFSTVKYEAVDPRKRVEFMVEAAKDGIVFFLPHVNYSADFSIRKFDGERIIQMGYNSIKNVGDAATKVIEAERIKHGPYTSYDDFVERVPKKSVNSRVVESLLADGALEFNKKVYINRTIKFNSTLYMKGARS